MRTVVTLIAALVLAHSAHAAEKFLEQHTDRALAAGNPAAVVDALEREVSRNNVVAALELGRMYRDGKVVAVDYAKARKFLKAAAQTDLVRLWYKLGIPAAQYELGVMLRDGVGGKADGASAAAWFEEAAELNYAQAQRALAQMYFKGAGVKHDPERAFVWSSIAARSFEGKEKEQMEQLRDLSQKELKPQELARAGVVVGAWKPKPT
jgi:TPR repeat protein